MIISRTPFRVSFAGGGSDLPEHFQKHGGAVLSMSINRYMYVTVNPSFDARLRISYSKTEIELDVKKIEHPLVREALLMTGVTRGVEITSIADVPSGTGLGSSSSFTVGLLNALYAYSGKLKSAEELARRACAIEIERVKEPIGKQDQTIAAFGGLQFIEFNRDGGVYVDPVVMPAARRAEWLSHISLYYLGRERSASAILAGQKKTLNRQAEKIGEMVEIAKSMRKILLSQKNLAEFGALLDEAWRIKRQLASGITNSTIDEAYAAARRAGALGGKLLGAGGSGFLLVFAPPSKRLRIQKALKDLRPISIDLEPQGSKIIYVG